MAWSRRQAFFPVWGHLQQLQSEMNQLLDRWGDGRRWLNMAGGYPPVNLWEEGDVLHVEAELPGMDLKGLEIYVTGGNQLTLKGERKPVVPEKGVWHREERPHGQFTRVLSLPYPVDADKVEARFENGVLRLKLPRHESSKPRKIQVKGQ